MPSWSSSTRLQTPAFDVLADCTAQSQQCPGIEEVSSSFASQQLSESKVQARSLSAQYSFICSEAFSCKMAAPMCFGAFLDRLDQEEMREVTLGVSRHVRTCHTRHDVGMLNKERGGGPKVVLATLPSLEAGLARQLFIEWARDSKNLIVFPLQPQVLSSSCQCKASSLLQLAS